VVDVLFGRPLGSATLKVVSLRYSDGRLTCGLLIAISCGRLAAVSRPCRSGTLT